MTDAHDPAHDDLDRMRRDLAHLLATRELVTPIPGASY